MNKTDNIAHVGKHVFEVAGLGLAPYRFTGMSENVHTSPDGTTKAGGSCDYCFTGIRYQFHLLSRDGKAFKVGCDCIDKSGDAGLMRAYKQSAQYRKLQKDKRDAKGAAAREACKALIEANRDSLASQPHPMGFIDRRTGTPLTLLDQVQWMYDHCGIAGITKYRKTLERYVSNIKAGLPAIS